MYVIALANQKGGVGKTALTTNLGCQAAATGAVAVVLDLDHPQRSTMKWGARREGDNPLVAEASASSLRRTLEAFREQGVAWAFLDLPGRSAPSVAAGLREAHLVLIPTRPTDVDLEAAADVVAAAQRLGKPYAFVMSIALAKRAEEFAKALKEAGHNVCPVVITQKVVVHDALAGGLGVNELAPRSASAGEFGTLFKWIDKQV